MFPADQLTLSASAEARRRGIHAFCEALRTTSYFALHTTSRQIMYTLALQMLRTRYLVFGLAAKSIRKMTALADQRPILPS